MTRCASRSCASWPRAGESTCGSFDLGVSKATRSHHFKVLREAGLTRTRAEGTHRHVSLRRDDVDARFPGLLGAVLTAAEAESGLARPGLIAEFAIFTSAARASALEVDLDLVDHAALDPGIDGGEHDAPQLSGR